MGDSAGEPNVPQAITGTWGEASKDAGITFVPSPSANLVGVAKKLQPSYSRLGAILCVLRALLFQHQADIRSSQRKKSCTFVYGTFFVLDFRFWILDWKREPPVSRGGRGCPKRRPRCSASFQLAVPRANASCPQFFFEFVHLRLKVAAGCRHDSRQDGGATLSYSFSFFERCAFMHAGVRAIQSFTGPE
jgi:hypothetical protein